MESCGLQLRLFGEGERLANMLISVVIPTLNREEPLCDTLQYFLRSETYRPFELIVIDQSEEHDTATTEFLASVALRMTYVKVAYKSLPKARNHGVRLSRGDIVVFVDDDVEPASGFLAAHAAPYANLRVAGVTGPTLAPGQALLGRAELGEKVLAVLTSRTAMRFDVNFSFSATWAAGCNMSFRKEVIERLGGFDENFFGVAIGEDVEFSHRVRAAGGLIRYSPEARLVHKNVPTGGCRTAANARRYIEAFVANTVYYNRRVRATRWERCGNLWYVFRKLVCNSSVIKEGQFVRRGVHFIGALATSRRRLKGLRTPSLSAPAVTQAAGELG